MIPLKEVLRVKQEGAARARVVEVISDMCVRVQFSDGVDSIEGRRLGR